jgi:cell wall-associated NlpC family hydrolase
VAGDDSGSVPEHMSRQHPLLNPPPRQKVGEDSDSLSRSLPRERARERVQNPLGWAADYVGIPFRSHGRDRSGCDCYGLLALVLCEVFHLEVPSYAVDYLDATDAEEIAALIAGEMKSRWKQITGTEAGATPEGPSPAFCCGRGQAPLRRAGEGAPVRPGDAIVLRIMGRAWHVGIVIDPAGWFLHTRPGVGSCLERWDAIRWVRRVMGFYRYGR